MSPESQTKRLFTFSLRKNNLSKIEKLKKSHKKKVIHNIIILIQFLYRVMSDRVKRIRQLTTIDIKKNYFDSDRNRNLKLQSILRSKPILIIINWKK